METKFETLSSKYVQGSNGYYRVLQERATGKIFAGWGINEQMTMNEIWNHPYAVYEYDSLQDYTHRLDAIKPSSTKPGITVIPKKED